MSRPDYVLRGECVTTAICKSGNTLITGSEEGKVTVYDTDIMRPTASWAAHKAQVMRLECVGDGVLSQGREGALSLWRGGICVRTASVPSTGFCKFVLSDDQRHCFVGIDEKSRVSHIDVKSLGVIRTFQPSEHRKKGMCWSVAQEENYVYLGYESGHFVLFDQRNYAKQVLEVKVHDEIVSALDVYSNTVITSSPDSTIKVTNLLLSDAESEQNMNPISYVSSAGDIPEPDSVHVSTDSVSVEEIRTIPLKCKGSSSLKVRPDGKLFVAAGWDGGLRLYSWSKLKLLGLIEAHGPETVTDMILFDNRIVCSGRDRKISFWTMY